MLYSEKDVMDFVEQEDVKFIRLAFCDINGKQKNISIMPSELHRAFTHGISIDASAIKGFGGEINSDLFLKPIPETLNILPWRPSRGRVVKMFCNIVKSDGTAFPLDSRRLLQLAVKEASDMGLKFHFGPEFEFYLFNLDENGNPTKEPFDKAGYMDVAPEDKGENVRREICLTLESMGIQPETSHHEEGPGQNEIDFRYSDPISAADNAVHFITVVQAAAQSNGLYADFSPKPIPGECGNGMHINISVKSKDGKDKTDAFMAGVLKHIREITFILNPTDNSYLRLGEKKAPKYVTWSPENRSQLVRIPAASGEYRRMEVRSADPKANPYLAFAGLIYAGLDGIRSNLTPPEAMNVNLFTADESVTSELEKLPETLEEALEIAKNSNFVKSFLPDAFFC
ncbi:MAG: glutamine synthetase family protein [Clostridia bacterium]|nr:glutamine synthetase family protein [Clostridia bacterium]